MPVFRFSSYTLLPGSLYRDLKKPEKGSPEVEKVPRGTHWILRLPGLEPPYTLGCQNWKTGPLPSSPLRQGDHRTGSVNLCVYLENIVFSSSVDAQNPPDGLLVR